jgi:prepilin-type N-terminal cleavage/methylation domain-containing protein
MQLKNNKAFSLIELSIVVLIIGILIAGVLASSTLVDKFRLSTARTLTQSSPVPSIKDLVLWFDTTSEKSFATSNIDDGTIINTWYDINPTLKTNNTATSTTGPTYQLDCLQGLPCLRFNGSDTYINSNLDIGRVTGVTVYAVFSTTNRYGDIVGTLLWDNNYGGNIYLGLDDVLYYEDYDWTDGVNVTARVPYVAGVIINSTSHNYYLNGVETTQSITQQPLSTLPNTIQIGAWNDDYFFGGDIGEIIIFNRSLKEEERKAVEKYLGQKWNINVSNNPSIG